MRRPIAHKWRHWIVFACVIFMAGCGDTQDHSAALTPTPPERPILKIYGPAGSKGAFDALQIASTLVDLPYEMRVFEGNTTASGIQGVLDGTFDLTVLMRRLRLDENLIFREFVRTPVAFYVNPSAGIDHLTREQAAAVFSGAVTNWSELGGADQEITVLLQEADDTSTEAVYEYIMLETPFTSSVRKILTDQEVLIVVDGLPGAIGFASWASKKYFEFVSDTQYPDAITLDGVHPSDPTYPLVSVVGVAYLPERESFLQPLFDWGERIRTSEVIRLLLPRFGVTLADDGGGG